ncbi:MAG: cytochrome c biogenesis protein CcsA [Mariprofundus sp.]|nr:cytochrome c biogenesis protein CcsA [Mariprofundus sp.]
MITSSILFFAAGLLSLLGSVIIWRDALQSRNKPAQGSANGIAGLLSVAIILNIWAIHLLNSVTAEGINFNLATGAAVLTLMVHLIYTIGILRHGIQGLGLFLLPVTALPLFLIPILPDAHVANWVHTSSLLETSHLLLSMGAYAILTLAAIHAVMQLLLDRALKKKQLSTFVQALPALMDIERHMFAQVKAATVLIAISVLTGLAWQWVELHHFALFSHKILLALFSLGILILLQIKHQQASWPTRVASQTVLTAFALLLASYFGVELIHSLQG